MNPSAHRHQIEQLLQAGNNSEALKRAMDYIEDYSAGHNNTDSIVKLSSEFYAYRKNRRNKQYTPEEADHLLNDILFRLRCLLDSIPDQDQHPADDPTVVAELDGVDKAFKSSRFHLCNINLRLQAGEITGIIGPNANGKSTLLKIIVGELQPDSGHLQFPGLTQNAKKKRLGRSETQNRLHTTGTAALERRAPRCAAL